MLDKLKNKVQSIQNSIDEFGQTTGLKLSEEQRNQRLDICKTCQYFFKPTTTCMKCGCFMAVKTYIPRVSCPVGKWTSIIKQEV